MGFQMQIRAEDNWERFGSRVSWGPQSPAVQNQPLSLQHAFLFWSESCHFWVHNQDLIIVRHVLPMWKLSGLAFKLYSGNKVSFGGKLGPMISCMAWSSECPMPQWLPPWRQRCLPLNVPLPYSCLFPCGLSLSCLFSFHYFLHDKFLPPPDALSVPRGESTPRIMREYTRLRSERTKRDDFLVFQASALSKPRAYHSF